MPFKAISDFEDAAKYQKNLKAALAEAHGKSLPVTLFESFPFKCEQDFVHVQALVAPMGKALDAVEARIVERERQQKLFETKRASLQEAYGKAYDPADAKDQKALAVLWAQSQNDAQAHSFADALAKLEKVETLIREVNGRTLEAKRARLSELKSQSDTLLAKPSAGETEALANAAKAVEAQLGNSDFAKSDTGLDQYEQTTQRLLKARQDKIQPETLAQKVEDFWIDQEANFVQKTKGKVNGELPLLRKELEEAKWKNAIKRAAGMMKYMSEDLAAQKDKSAAALKASQAFAAALNQADTEDQAATSYDDTQFAAGMLRSIWTAVKSVRTNSPANGSIAGVHSLADVEAVIGTGRTTANSGVLTNFHVPGGRPQAKWAKDFTRPDVQANFCCYWRTIKVNIHVNVDARSYFDRYGNEEDWTLIPHQVRASLGRA